MRTVVFGDVHGNLPALEEMLRAAGPADQYLSLGDVVNYGPWSNECVDLVESLPGIARIMGNHDEAFLRGSYPGSHPLVRRFFEFCRPRFDRIETLQRYVPSARVGAFTAAHTLGDAYIFADTPVALDRDYIIGHSHHQFHRSVGGFELYNAGSVGQNRAQINVINFLICGPGERDVELRAIRYDPEPVFQEMERLGYPAECVAYYRTKPRL